METIYIVWDCTRDGSFDSLNDFTKDIAAIYKSKEGALDYIELRTGERSDIVYYNRVHHTINGINDDDYSYLRIEELKIDGD